MTVLSVYFINLILFMLDRVVWRCKEPMRRQVFGITV